MWGRDQIEAVNVQRKASSRTGVSHVYCGFAQMQRKHYIARNKDFRDEIAVKSLLACLRQSRQWLRKGICVLSITAMPEVLCFVLTHVHGLALNLLLCCALLPCSLSSGL